MSTIKKYSLIILLILLMLSFLHDLSKQDQSTSEQSSEIVEVNPNNITHIKIKPGDTILSITEEINNIKNLDIDNIIADFQKLNPGTKPHELIPNTFYYFPLYNDIE